MLILEDFSTFMKVLIVNKISGEVFEISSKRFNRLVNTGKLVWDVDNEIYVFDPEDQHLIDKKEGKYGIFILDTDAETIYDVLRYYKFEIKDGRVMGLNSIAKHNIFKTPLDTFTNLGGYNVIIINGESDMHSEEFKKLVKSTLGVLSNNFKKFDISRLFYTMLKHKGTEIIKRFSRENYLKNYIVDRYPGKNGVDLIVDLDNKNNPVNIVNALLRHNTNYSRSKNGGIKLVCSGFQVVLNVTADKSKDNSISIFKSDGKFVFKFRYGNGPMDIIMRNIRERKDNEFINVVKNSFFKEEVYNQNQIEDIKETRMAMNINTYFGLNVRVPKHGYKIIFRDFYGKKTYVNAKLDNELSIEKIITKIRDYFNVKRDKK